MEDAHFNVDIGDRPDSLHTSSSDGAQPQGTGRGESMGSGAAAASTAGSVPSEPAPTTEARKGKRKRSWVWNHFTCHTNYIDPKGNELGPKATCNYCDHVFSSNTLHGVGSHSRHLRSRHKEILNTVELSSGSADQTNVLANFKYSKEKMRHGMALYVASAEQPFNSS